MGREMLRRHSDLGGLILNCLERRTILTCPQIAVEINGIAQKSGKDGWRSENTFKNHLDKLIERGKVRHLSSWNSPSPRKRARTTRSGWWTKSAMVSARQWFP
jgi:hypothetical protein